MKKGYTLVELIVVIVVLFIIGAITLPIILTKINNSRYEKAKASAYDMIESVKLYHYNKVKDNNGVFEEVTFNCDKICKNLDEVIESESKPNSGTITISSDGTITGNISYYEGDYTFYICNSILYDEKISNCLPSNNLTLKSDDYEEGQEIDYAGLIWNVISDNGDNTTLVLKTIIDHANLGNKKYNFEESDVNKKLNEWFSSNLTLKSAKEQDKLVSTKIEEYETYVRIPSKEDAGIKSSSDKCKKTWCNIEKGYWLFDYIKSSEGIYKAYSIGEDGETNTMDVTNENGIRPVITVKEH